MNLKRFGSSAVLVHLPPQDTIRAYESLTRSGVPEIAEIIPAEDTLLIRLDQPCSDEVLRRLSDALTQAATDTRSSLNDITEAVQIGVQYDGEDLAEVAAACDMSVDHLVDVHSGAEYRVAFCGFSPGFAYLTGLPARLHLPRRATPRTSVPAGSLAIAEHYSAVYPRRSPGGWHLLGRTDEVLFDPHRDDPALLYTGMRVRFIATRDSVTVTQPSPPVQAPHAVQGPDDDPALEVVAAGGLSLVQDLGRFGWSAAAVSPSGAWDRASHALAQRLVGNPADAAGVECLGGGLRLRALRAITIAVTGAPGPLHRTRSGVRVAVDPLAPLTLAAGDEVTIGAATSGVRRYIAFRGGIVGAPILGSRSRDTLSGLGQGPLAPADRLSIGTAVDPIPGIDGVAPEAPASGSDAAFWPSSVWSLLDDDSRAALGNGEFSVSPASDRIGIRLTGPTCTWSRLPSSTTSRPLVRGAIQLPPDGQPVILGPDHPTTGGYPVIGVLCDPDGPAQWAPGAMVRLSPHQ